MKIGLGLQNTIPGTPGRLLIDTARRAEEAGFSTIATLDRVAYPSYESFVALAAAAAATERVGLLTNIVLAPARNAIMLAKQAASLDQISGGRFTLGLGAGSRRDDFDAAERDFETRGQRFDQDLDLMHEAWRGEAVGACERPPSPKPVRDDRVPILIGGSSDAAIERTVRWGEGWTAGGGPPEVVGPFAQRVREAWEASDREGAPRLVALAYYSLGEDAEAESRENLLHYYEYLGSMGEAIAASVPRTDEAVRAAVKGFEEAGFEELIFYPTVARLEQIDRLAEVVL